MNLEEATHEYESFLKRKQKLTEELAKLDEELGQAEKRLIWLRLQQRVDVADEGMKGQHLSLWKLVIEGPAFQGYEARMAAAALGIVEQNNRLFNLVGRELRGRLAKRKVKVQLYGDTHEVSWLDELDSLVDGADESRHTWHRVLGCPTCDIWEKTRLPMYARFAKMPSMPRFHKHPHCMTSLVFREGKYQAQNDTCKKTRTEPVPDPYIPSFDAK